MQNISLVMILRFRRFLKFAGWLFLSIAALTVTFFMSAFPVDQTADTPDIDVPYGEFIQNEFLTAVLTEKLIFSLKFDIVNREADITCYPANSFYNGAGINKDRLRQSLTNLFSYPADRICELDDENLEQIVTKMGGFFGSVMENGKLTSTKRISGLDFVSALNTIDKPQKAELEYLAGLFLEFAKTFLESKNFSDIFDYSDISYPDYYIYKQKVSECLKNCSLRGADGSWSTDRYILNEVTD